MKSPESLAAHFKIIIKEETSRPIPNKPPTNFPSRKYVPTLGKFSKHVIAMDRSRSENDREFKYSTRKIRYDRESDGFFDQYMEIQSVSIPSVNHILVSNNIEMIFELIELDGTRCLE